LAKLRADFYRAFATAIRVHVVNSASYHLFNFQRYLAHQYSHWRCGGQTNSGTLLRRLQDAVWSWYVLRPIQTQRFSSYPRRLIFERPGRFSIPSSYDEGERFLNHMLVNVYLLPMILRALHPIDPTALEDDYEMAERRRHQQSIELSRDIGLLLRYSVVRTHYIRDRP
jgi:hypothetical protein